MKVLPRKFYLRNPKQVAIDLLGKLLVRKIGKHLLIGKIVETEAYFGKEDPASRAYSGRPKFCVKLMYGEVGRALIYMVHANWLFNIVAHETGKGGAVLIRAVEPIKGIEIMKRFRKVEKITDLTNGPGKLCKAFNITKEFNGIDLTKKGDIFVASGKKEKFTVESSFRIGVSKDLPEKLRFYIKNNIFVSK